jgi:nitric oxide dioxygenase
MGVKKWDLIDGLAILLIGLGITLFIYGISLNPPGSIQDLVQTQFGDWTPGFVTDGVLLIVINRVIHRHERRRVISQVASLSNEFALDAVRRCRDEGWLQDGGMRARKFDNARLASADLSDAKLPGTSFRFSDMSAADLTHADFSDADLTGTNFSDADLRWADLSNACLEWTDLRGAQLDGAKLQGADAAYASIDSEFRDSRDFGKAIVGGFLTSRQMSLIKMSFDKFRSRGEAASARFYQRLFENAPSVRAMFPDDASKQARKFLQSLNVIVGSLSSSERTTRMLQRLGERHQDYGVKPDHYPIVGHALVETLREELGDEFTEELEEAWSDAFELISSAMLSGTQTRKLNA